MVKLILDYSKWRCGGDIGENVVGKGATVLLNEEGFMCCLGQFAPQLNPDVKEENIFELACPQDVNMEIPLLSTPYEPPEDVDDEYKLNKNFEDTNLSIAAMQINDNHRSTPERKIEELKVLFKQCEYEIEVINKPQ